GRVTVAVRTHGTSMTVPLIAHGKLLVSDEYLKALARIANSLFDHNAAKLKKFTSAVGDFITNREKAAAERRSANGMRESCGGESKHAGTTTAGDSLPAVKWVPSQLPPIERWGHTAHLICSGRKRSILVLGGYGRQAGQEGSGGAVKRWGEVAELDLTKPCKERAWALTHPGGPREMHASIQVGASVIMFGGRASPSSPFGVLEIYRMGTGWSQPQLQSTACSPLPFWGHTFTLCSDGAGQAGLLMGGRDSEGVHGEAYLLRWKGDAEAGPHDFTWEELPGGMPEPLFFHSATALQSGHKVIVVGGLTSLGSTQGTRLVWTLDLMTKQWSSSAACPLHIFAHQATLCREDVLLVAGGEVATAQISDDGQLSWRIEASSPDGCILSHHAMLKDKDRVCTVGGGVHLSAFGQSFARGWEVPIAAPPECAAEDGLLLTCLVAAKAHVKRVKVAMEAARVLCKARKIVSASSDGGEMALPLADRTSASYKESAEINELLSSGVARVVKVPIARFDQPSGAVSTTPRHVLERDLAALLVAVGEAEDVARDAARAESSAKFQQLGSAVLVLASAFSSSAWKAVDLSAGSRLWELVAKAFNARCVFRRAEIDPGPLRRSRAQLLWPQPEGPQDPATSSIASSISWVTVTENRVKQSFDILKVMFSTGNITEKMRVARFPCSGETVVDLYAGIGYYTLPYLVHGGASLVHACEWNPDSVNALRHNLKENGVDSRCQVHEGDNAVTTARLGRCADRVNLGLLPSSEPGWELACKVMKDTGGWAHVHGNIKDTKQVQEKACGTEPLFPLPPGKYQYRYLPDSLIGPCHFLHPFPPVQALGRGRWIVQCRHLERVKPYAPRVIHSVADLECRPV
ncbi:unnamed protein product, partial [Chrysoparadoxa australica]